MPYINGIDLSKVNYRLSEKILQQIDNIIMWCLNNQFFADFSISNFIIDSNDKVWMCDLDSANFRHFKQIFIFIAPHMYHFGEKLSLDRFGDDYFIWFKNKIWSYYGINNNY